jgi:hypothetical protein
MSGTSVVEPRPRAGRLSRGLIALSVGVSVDLSIVLDAVLFGGGREIPIEIIVAALLFNVSVVLFASVGSLIERRRPGHAIGRLLMLSGPLYAYLGLIWLTGEMVRPLVDPTVYRLISDAGVILSWIGVVLIVGWIPLLFPTGTLPGPRWRVPTAVLAIIFAGSLALLAAQGSLTTDETTTPAQDDLVTTTSIAVLGFIALAIAAVVTRFRSGDQVERLQVRWFGAAVALCALGGIGAAVESSVRPADGPLLMTLVLYVGILAIPISIGIAVLRYRLYELDRIISRTISYGLVSGLLLGAYALLILLLQGPLGAVTSGETVSVAVSTLIVAALFQPVRRRVQRAVDHRFHRASFDAEQTVLGFAGRLRSDVDIATVLSDLHGTIHDAIRPAYVGLWLRTSDGRVTTHSDRREP